MKEIIKLDDRYVVVKRSDVYKYLRNVEPTPESVIAIDLEQVFYRCLNLIGHGREDDKKPFSNHYVVLNLDDPIDLDWFGDRYFGDEFEDTKITKVKDIAVGLVNAILIAKEEVK